jgi:hypothetical protein
VTTLELEFVDPTTAAAQRWHARIARSGILRIASFLAVLLGVLAFVHTKIDTRVRRARLIREAVTDRASYPATARLIDLLDRTTMDLARDPFVPLVEIDRAALDALVQSDGVYLRALQDEVRTPRSVHTASQESRKDAFVACLLRPPADAAHDTFYKAATHYRWRVDLETIASHVHNAEDLDAGFRVSSRAWLDEVTATWEPTPLRLLDHERAARTPRRLERAVRAGSAKYLAVVLDELPTGYSAHAGNALSEGIRGSRMDAIVSMPHSVRVGIVDASGKTLLRVRESLDAADIKVPNALADAEELQGCQAAVAVRSAAL